MSFQHKENCLKSTYDDGERNRGGCVESGAK